MGTMPKPTTHTDIVIVTKEDPSTGARSMESVQLTLVGAGVLDSESKIIGHEVPIKALRTEVLDGPPVGLNLTVGGKILELAYAARVIHVADFAQMVSEPWPRPQGQVIQPSSKSFVWKSTAGDALVTEFELSIFATLGGTKLDIQHQKSTTSGTQRLEVQFLDGTTEVGELIVTAVMQALPTF